MFPQAQTTVASNSFSLRDHCMRNAFAKPPTHLQGRSSEAVSHNHFSGAGTDRLTKHDLLHPACIAGCTCSREREIDKRPNNNGTPWPSPSLDEGESFQLLRCQPVCSFVSLGVSHLSILEQPQLQQKHRWPFPSWDEA